MPDAPVSSSRTAALIRVADQPPALLPTIVLHDLVPFPGPVVPIALDAPWRREAVLQAKNNSGFLLLVNRRSLRKASTRLPNALNLLHDDDDDDENDAANDAGHAAGDNSPDNVPHSREVHEAATALHETSDAENDPRAKTSRTEAAHKAAKQRQAAAASSPSEKKGGNTKMDAIRLEAELLAASSDETADERASIKHIGELGSVGIVARLIKVMRLSDERITALLQLMRRAQPVELVSTEPCLCVKVHYPVEIVANDEEYEALFRQVKLNLQAFFAAHPTVSDELKAAALSLENPGVVADFVAQHLSRDFDERLALLCELNLTKRMRRVLEITVRELDLLTVGNRMSQEIRDKVEKHQRDFLLREQLRAIRNELGEEKDPGTVALQELRDKLNKADLPNHARSRADEELKRLQILPTESPEHNVVRTYLEWIAALPWNKLSQDVVDVRRARQILDEDHYGLEEVKERITEFLAVHQLNPHKVGTLMCFAGPPGVGKTSLGQSIARAIGREFYRFSVGGMRDEAEIKGHRRTYVGAMPGRILQALRQMKTANPVFMLDELDKMGADWRGDPSSALLEVLDPAQNKSFMDHYLDLTFDLSRVMFIATVNISSEIPAALRDRLEVIDLPGYIPEEKLRIAWRYLLPRQRQEHGLKPEQLQPQVTALRRVISEYTHEAGVRELERQVSKICRKRAMQVIEGDTQAWRLRAEMIPKLLGPPKKYDERLHHPKGPGVAIGLAWTPNGGEVLRIEVVSTPGKGRIKLTGQLGEVMNESANIAVSYVKNRAKSLHIDPKVFDTQDFHIHFPAGAVKKDGPSAGITVTTALISLLTGRAILPRLAMTGEITLLGEVLAIGGLREKVVAARGYGIHRVIVPHINQPDISEIPDYVRKHLQFVYAKTFDDVLAAAFKSTAKKALRRQASAR